MKSLEKWSQKLADKSNTKRDEKHGAVQVYSDSETL